MIPRSDGTKKVSPKYEEDAYDNDRFIVKGGAVKKDNSNTPDSKDHVYAPNAKIANFCISRQSEYFSSLNSFSSSAVPFLVKRS